MQMHTQTNAQGPQTQSLQPHGHTSSLSETDTVHSCLVSKGRECCWGLSGVENVNTSLLVFQPGPPFSSHNSPHIMSTVMWCSIVWNEGAKTCSTAQCVCRHQTVLWRSPLSSLYLTVWGGHIIPTTLIYSKHCTHSLVSDMVQCTVSSILHTHNA